MSLLITLERFLLNFDKNYEAVQGAYNLTPLEARKFRARLLREIRTLRHSVKEV